MKQLFTYLCVILFCVFNACSNDEEDNNIAYPDRRVSKIEYSYNNSTSHDTEYFTYDNQGRWIKSEHTHYYYDNYNNAHTLTHTITLSYSNNSITYNAIEYSNGDELEDKEDVTFKIDNNLITSRGDNSELDKYRYSNGYLSGIGFNYADFEYSNGNLVKVVEHDIYTITYTEYEDKIGFSTFDVNYNDGSVALTLNNPLYQFGYFGKKSKNLIEAIKINNETYLQYIYEFDSDGYVVDVLERRWGSVYRTYKIYYE